MSKYASETKVSSIDSRAEIERTLMRYGADGFMYGTEGSRAIVAFRMADRHIRFILHLPSRDLKDFTTYMRGSVAYRREPHMAEAKWEQACRQRWRALALVIKAKLEAVECGISELQDEFLANIIMPDGQSVSQMTRDRIALAYDTGKVQDLLPDYSGDNQ